MQCHHLRSPHTWQVISKTRLLMQSDDLVKEASQSGESLQPDFTGGPCLPSSGSGIPDVHSMARECTSNERKLLDPDFFLLQCQTNAPTQFATPSSSSIHLTQEEWQGNELSYCWQRPAHQAAASPTNAKTRLRQGNQDTLDVYSLRLYTCTELGMEPELAKYRRHGCG